MTHAMFNFYCDVNKPFLGHALTIITHGFISMQLLILSVAVCDNQWRYRFTFLKNNPMLSPRHAGRQPRCDHGDVGNPPDRRVVAKYLKNAPLCDLCEPNCPSTTTSASVRRSYHDLTAPRTRARWDHRRPSAIRMRPYSDATTT